MPLSFADDLSPGFPRSFAELWVCLRETKRRTANYRANTIHALIFKRRLLRNLWQLAFAPLFCF
jgi:hypothetical protein